jgi:molecular chaperone GrpE
MTDKETTEGMTETDPTDGNAPQPSSDPDETTPPATESGENPAAAEESPAEAVTLEEKLEKAEQQARDNHERFLRTAAELDNFRKRKEREVSDLRKYANQSLLRELLGVVDNLERALASSGASSEPEGLVEGVDMTLKELLKIFDQFGVKPVEALEKPFDPAVHEAVMQEPSDAFPANTVIKELQKGYMLRERLLRPAMVVVSTESA